MKKKIIIPIIMLILALIICSVVVIVKKHSESRLTKTYEKMSENGQYQFERSTKNEENKIIVSEKENKKIIDMYNYGNHTTTLIKDNTSYLILHDKEEYYDYNNIISEENPLLEELKKISENEYTTGKEEVNGEKYYYEEYDNTSYFLLYAAKDMNPDTAKTRFYFKGNNLVYIKTIYTTTEGQNEEELWKVNIKYEVEDKIFEIPENYAESLL